MTVGKLTRISDVKRIMIVHDNIYITNYYKPVYKSRKFKHINITYETRLEQLQHASRLKQETNQSAYSITVTLTNQERSLDKQARRRSYTSSSMFISRIRMLTYYIFSGRQRLYHNNCMYMLVINYNL